MTEPPSPPIVPKTTARCHTCNSANAEIIKPAENLSAYDVIKIQLNALKNNDDKDNGIKQTWIFAHPELCSTTCIIEYC